MKIKYVIFGYQFPVLLSKANQHSDVRLHGQPTSAGFCSFQWSPEDCGFKAEVWGESISLSLKSDPADAIFIERLLNG